MKVLFPLILSFILLSPANLFAQAGTSTTDTVAVQKPVPIPLTQITNGAEEISIKFNKISKELEPIAEIHSIDSLLPEFTEYLANEGREIEADRLMRSSRQMLESLYREWQTYSNKLNVSKTKLDTRSENLNSIIKDLNKILIIWNLTAENLKLEEETPQELLDRVQSIIKEAADLHAEATRQRSEVVVLGDKVTEQNLLIDKNLNDISKAQAEFRKNLFIKDSPFIWQVRIKDISFSGFKNSLIDTWNEEIRNLGVYFSLQISTFYRYLAVLILLIILLLVLRSRFDKLHLSQNDRRTALARYVISHPVIASFVLAFLLFFLFFPSRPVLLTEVLMLGALVTVIVLLRGILDKHVLPFLIFLLGIFVIDKSQTFFYTQDILHRYYILFESLIALLAFIWYFRREAKVYRVNLGFNNKVVRYTALVIHLLMGISFVANIIGYVSLAGMLIGVTITGMVTAVVIYGSFIVGKSLLITLLRIRGAGDLYIVKKHIEILEKRVINLLVIFAYFLWIKAVLDQIDLFRPFLNWIYGLLDLKWEIGKSEISMASILGFVLVLIITYALSKLISLILEDEIFARIKLKKGLPEAISMVVKVVIVTFGVYIALMAAGFDLSKFSLMAGALGVGIGFGLQTIIYNFVSGLILVFERPINVGDTIEVESLVGIVKRIGMRSSNVRTYDGAEVIVPNGNLIANQVINWTLSDEKRRLEIKVGAAYGSDPNEVLKILRKIAENHDNIFNDPPPLTLFDGFGDSSLNFRLLCWAPYEVGLSTRSDISIAIYNAFKEANITIPFPQHDIHIKSESPEKPGKMIADENPPPEKK